MLTGLRCCLKESNTRWVIELLCHSPHAHKRDLSAFSVLKWINPIGARSLIDTETPTNQPTNKQMAFQTVRRLLRRARTFLMKLFNRELETPATTTEVEPEPAIVHLHRPITPTSGSVAKTDHVDQVLLLKSSLHPELTIYRVRTLTGKEIELDVEPEYKVYRQPIAQN